MTFVPLQLPQLLDVTTMEEAQFYGDYALLTFPLRDPYDLNDISTHFCKIEDFVLAEAAFAEAKEHPCIGMAFAAEKGHLAGVALCYGEAKTAYIPVGGLMSEDYLKDHAKMIASTAKETVFLDLKEAVKLLELNTTDKEL